MTFETTMMLANLVLATKLPVTDVVLDWYSEADESDSMNLEDELLLYRVVSVTWYSSFHLLIIMLSKNV